MYGVVSASWMTVDTVECTTLHAPERLSSPMSSNDDVIAADIQTVPWVHSLGAQQFDPVWSEKWHRATRCELLHVLNGVVTLEMERSRVTGSRGDTLLVPAGVRHRDRFDLERGLDVFIIQFEWPQMNAFGSRVLNEDLVALPRASKARPAHLIRWMRTELKQAHPVDRLVANARLFTILCVLLREVTRMRRDDMAEELSAGQRRRTALIDGAKRYVQTHFGQGITLEDIALALDVSGYYLSHVFSEESDFSLFEYVTTVRMENARVMLAEGGHTVREVAAAVGYEDPNYFAKVFRRYADCSPSRYAADSVR